MPAEKMTRLFWSVIHEKSVTYTNCDKWNMALISDLYYKSILKIYTKRLKLTQFIERGSGREGRERDTDTNFERKLNLQNSWQNQIPQSVIQKNSRKINTLEFSTFEHCWILTSILTGSIVFICTFGADEDRSRCPNWFRWSSSAGRKGCGIGMDFEGDGLVRIGGLEKSSDWKIRFRATF